MVKQDSQSGGNSKVLTMRLRPHNYLPAENLRAVAASGASRENPPALPSSRAGAAKMAQDQQVVDMIPLLHRIARKMRTHLPAHVEVDDLVGAGVLGLIDAVQKFNPNRNVKLNTYAQHRIRGAIIDSLRAMDGASRDIRAKSKKAEQSHRELESQLGRPATNDEIARAQGMSLKAWYRTVRDLQAVGVEWLRPTEFGSHPYFNEETLPAEGQDTQFDLCYLRERREILDRALACLSSRDRLVMELYYFRELTMKQIGAELNIDESRVSQLHSAALARLRNAVAALLRAPQHSTVPCDDDQMLKAA